MFTRFNKTLLTLAVFAGSAAGARAKGVDLDGVGKLALAPNWDLLGSLGVADARLNTDMGKDSSSAFKMGVGLQHDLTPSTAVRVSYDRYHFTNAFDDKPNIGQTALGVQFGF
jgi:OOP family OmpA-OmpF porin